MSEYEAKELAKVRLVLEAAMKNTSQDEVEISTSGHDPYASVRVKAYILDKALTRQPQPSENGK